MRALFVSFRIFFFFFTILDIYRPVDHNLRMPTHSKACRNVYTSSYIIYTYAHAPLENVQPTPVCEQNILCVYDTWRVVLRFHWTCWGHGACEGKKNTLPRIIREKYISTTSLKYIHYSLLRS